MSAMNDEQEFRELLIAAAADPAGWSSPAGEALAHFLTRVLEPKSATTEGAGDCAAEAVLVISGRGGLAASAARILEMDAPLGFVIKSVSLNVDRAALAETMGVGSRQVGAGVQRVQRFSELTADGGPALDAVSMASAWAPARGEGSPESAAVVREFAAVLIQRFRVRGAVVARCVEVAADTAVDGERGVGATASVTRRRLRRFLEAGEQLREVGLARERAAAMAGLLFGTERHPEWSLLSECAHARRAGRAVRVSSWHERQARVVAARPGGLGRSVGVQPALFETSERAGRAVLRRVA